MSNILKHSIKYEGQNVLVHDKFAVQVLSHGGNKNILRKDTFRLHFIPKSIAYNLIANKKYTPT